MHPSSWWAKAKDGPVHPFSIWDKVKGGPMHPFSCWAKAKDGLIHPSSCWDKAKDVPRHPSFLLPGPKLCSDLKTLAVIPSVRMGTDKEWLGSGM